MVYCRSRQLRAKTMNSYEQGLRLFERWCQEQMSIDDVSKITENIIRRYINELQERGKYTFYSDENSKYKNYPDRRRDFRQPVSITTINNYIRYLRAFFNWLEKEYISDEDFKRLMAALDKSYFPEHRDYTMIMLMIDSGMRLGECSSLLIDDIDLARKQIFLRADITKGRKDRVVFFSNKTETVIRRWLQFKDRYVETDYLFPIKSTGARIDINRFETNFKHYLKRVGLNDGITPHCLRNNFAKRCLMNGMDIYTLSRILGHSSVAVTEQAYLDLTDEDLGKRYQHYIPIGAL